MKNKDKIKIFTEITDKIYLSELVSDEIGELRFSSLDNCDKIIKEIKTLKVIELDNIEGFLSYMSYDHFIIFKYNKEHYFCNTELSLALGKHCMLKITDYRHHLRKDKIIEIRKNNSL